MQLTAEDVPPLFVELPDGFHPLPIGTAGAERAAAVARLAREVYPNGTGDLWTGVAPTFDDVTQAMAEADLALAAIGIFGAEPSGVAQCAFTVAVTPSNHPTPEAAVNGIREILLRTSSVEAQCRELPSGPAVIGISIHEVTSSGRFTTTGQDAPVRLGRLRGYVPFPTGPYLAVLTLETPAMDYWENFSVMMAGILDAVAFPDAPAADPARPGAS